jgi:ATP-binding cassette subfamily F protein uup
MDEPTNDLDLETLELLEAQLVDWPGTLLLVSHDRVFLDNVVTSTIVFEGGGRIQEYVGGYVDWLRQRRTGVTSGSASARSAPADSPEPARSPTAAARRPSAGTGGEPAKGVRKTKLSYNEQRELAALPARIEALESEHAQLQSTIASPDFYREGADAIAKTMARHGAVEEELLAAYERWDELKARTGA